MIVLDFDSFDWSKLEPAFERSETESVEQYRQMCIADFAQLWSHENIHAITTVHETKTGRAIKIVAMSGEYNHEIVKEIEAFGIANGCNKCLFTGRIGWQKIVHDYKPTSITMEKELWNKQSGR